MSGRAKLGSRALAISAAIVCSGALAAGTIAATLQATAHPTRAHKGALVTVTLSGSFKRSELLGNSHKAELVSFVQFHSRKCKADGARELAAGAQLYYAAKIRHSPFRHSDTKVGNDISVYRICAYLYPRPITKTTNDKPLRRATVKFRVVK